MIQYICVAEDPVVLERVRRWFTSTYGSSITRCVETTIEVTSLCTINPGVRAVIADLPPGTLLHKRYDELARCTSGETKIVLINSDTGDIFVPSGKRRFSVVPLQDLERGLWRLLAVH